MIGIISVELGGAWLGVRLKRKMDVIVDSKNSVDTLPLSIYKAWDRTTPR
jgi:hypothetical protein